MKKILLSVGFVLVAGLTIGKAQINVGSTVAPDASIMLQVSGSTKGFRPPQVSLASTGTFGLTSPSVANQAYGMVVYNGNTGITGNSAYPAHGAGDYWWDGSGWVSFVYKNPVELAANGGVSGGVNDNVATPALDLSTVIISTADMTTTGNNTVKILTSGTYKIDVDCLGASLSNNNTNRGIFTTNIYKSGSTVLASGSVTQTNITSGTTANLPIHMYISYTGSFSAGDLITFNGITEGMPATVTTAFQIVSLQITRVQ